MSLRLVFIDRGSYALLLFLILFSTRRMLLGRTPNLADPFSKTTVKATAGKQDFVL